MTDSILNSEGLGRMIENRRSNIQRTLSKYTVPVYMNGIFVGAGFPSPMNLDAFVREAARWSSEDKLRLLLSRHLKGLLIPAAFIDTVLDIASDTKRGVIL